MKKIKIFEIQKQLKCFICIVMIDQTQGHIATKLFPGSYTVILYQKVKLTNNLM